MTEETMQPATEVIHRFDDPQSAHGAVNPPVVHASLYAFPDYETWKGVVQGTIKRAYVYNRSSNPTVHLLEQKIAGLEGGADCVASSSGMSAISMTLFGLLKSGDHLLCIDTVYSPVRNILEKIFADLQVEVTYFTPCASSELTPLIRENTRMIYLESPSSGLFQIQDLRAAAALAKEKELWTVIDNTWATPLYQKPLDLGFDVSLHAGTKYISGHSDLMLGLVTGSAEAMKRIRRVHNLLGASLAPDDAYLALRGLRTLPLRLKQHESSGLEIARWLQEQPAVAQVLHPGLPNFPQHKLHRSQTTGDSGLFGFRLHPRGETARAAFVNSLELFSLGYSWGGYESLLSPLEFSHYGNDELRQSLGLTDDHYRVSIGLEDVEDLKADLGRALERFEQTG